MYYMPLDIIFMVGPSLYVITYTYVHYFCLFIVHEHYVLLNRLNSIGVGDKIILFWCIVLFKYLSLLKTL